MAIKWAIEIDGDRRAFVIDPSRGGINWVHADKAGERAKNVRPVADTVHGILIDEHKQLIDTEGSYIGHKWPGYTEQENARYVPWKVKKIGNYGPMRWSPIGARLIPSLTGSGPDHVWKVTNTSFEYGTSLDYAKGHHDGTGYAKKWMGGYKLPQRKLIGIGNEGSNELRRTLQRYIVTGDTTRGGISRTGGVH